MLKQLKNPRCERRTFSFFRDDSQFAKSFKLSSNRSSHLLLSLGSKATRGRSLCTRISILPRSLLVNQGAHAPGIGELTVG